MAIKNSCIDKNEKRSAQKTLSNFTKVDHTGQFWPGQKAFFRSYVIFKGSTLRRKAFRFKIPARTVFLGQGILTVSLGIKK